MAPGLKVPTMRSDLLVVVPGHLDPDGVTSGLHLEHVLVASLAHGEDQGNLRSLAGQALLDDQVLVEEDAQQPAAQGVLEVDGQLPGLGGTSGRRLEGRRRRLRERASVTAGGDVSRRASVLHRPVDEEVGHGGPAHDARCPRAAGGGPVACAGQRRRAQRGRGRRGGIRVWVGRRRVGHEGVKRLLDRIVLGDHELQVRPRLGGRCRHP